VGRFDLTIQNFEELRHEMQEVGYQFEMRSSENYNVGDEFAWSGLTLRVTIKKPDTYGFEVIANEERPGVRRGTI
jgi:hypothetical protein